MNRRPTRRDNLMNYVQLAPPRRAGIAIVLVIVAVAAAAVIGSAYVASQLNAPQIVGNVNEGIEARYLADSGSDLAMALMECETFDWRTEHVGGILLDNLPIGNGYITIGVKDICGPDPDRDCEYPVITTTGSAGNMSQIVSVQAHTPLAEKAKETVDVDLSEFAAFGHSSVSVVSGWITRWGASPHSNLGLPVNLGTNGTTRASIVLPGKANAPDARGHVMASAVVGTIDSTDLSGAPIPRVEVSSTKTVLLPAPPPPNLSGITWANSRTPTVSSDVSFTLSANKRYNSLTINSGATLNINLGGAKRIYGISGPLTIQNGGVLRIENGQLDLVVQGALTMFDDAAIELGPNGALCLYVGGTMTIDDSVIGLPVRIRDLSRDAREGLDEYFDPARCTLYRITSINSTDLNLLDLDNAADWTWTDTASKSWIVNTRSFVCGRIYGHSRVGLSIDNRSAVFGNAVANTITIANESAIYYDHSLDEGTGYTNPASRLYAAPMDLRDDIRLLLTDLSATTLSSIQLLLTSAPPLPTLIDAEAPTPRDSARVAHRWWKRYGAELHRDRQADVHY